jgi:hypothetical protein
VHLRARDYDPATGQFLTVDPAVDSTRQPYAYTGNSPLQLTDPSGLDAWGDYVEVIWGNSSMGRVEASVNSGTSLYEAIVMEYNPVYHIIHGVDAAVRHAQAGCWELVGNDLLEVAGGIVGVVAIAFGGASIIGKIGTAARAAARTTSAVEPSVMIGGGRTVVIGEDMSGRVQPYADSIGAHTYKPDPSAPRTEWMQNNENWINQIMDEGWTIIDRGPAPGRANYPNPTSEYYVMELREILRRTYDKYFKL